MKREIVIGTRESELAMQQAKWTCRRLQELHPDYHFTIRGMTTTGDKILNVALAKIGDKGLFTKELELALERKEIDLAVHSMKDLPTKLPQGLMIGAITEREYAGDVLIAPGKKSINDLPTGAVIGTSSLRRQAQLLNYRPDFKIKTIRGNINTRLRKQKEQNLDGLILAYAGIYRMGWEDIITQKIPFSICLPAVGQGSLGIEIRQGDQEVAQLVSRLDHKESRISITAERALLAVLEGGCQIPIGSFGQVKGNILKLEAVVASLDGKNIVRSEIQGPAQNAYLLGEQLAQNLLQMGAGDILKKCLNS